MRLLIDPPGSCGSCITAILRLALPLLHSSARHRSIPQSSWKGWAHNPCSGEVMISFRTVLRLRPQRWRCWAYTQPRDPSGLISLVLGSPRSVSPRNRQSEDQRITGSTSGPSPPLRPRPSTSTGTMDANEQLRVATRSPSSSGTDPSNRARPPLSVGWARRQTAPHRTFRL